MSKTLLFEKLRTLVDGEIVFDTASLKTHSKDASIFEIKPEVVIYPKHTKDVRAVIRFVNENKKEFPTLSVTARSAGTDMSGGPLNNSIILDFNVYFYCVKIYLFYVSIDNDQLKGN